MNDDFEIVIKDQSFERFGDTLDTEIYVRCGDACFPCEDWTDMAKSIISMWIEDVTKYLYTKARVNYKLFFMDGSYHLSVNQYRDEMEIQGIENDRPVKFTCKITVQVFLKKLWDALCLLETFIWTNEKCRTDRDRLQHDIDYYKKKLEGVSRGRFS